MDAARLASEQVFCNFHNLSSPSMSWIMLMLILTLYQVTSADILMTARTPLRKRLNMADVVVGVEYSYLWAEGIGTVQSMLMPFRIWVCWRNMRHQQLFCQSLRTDSYISPRKPSSLASWPRYGWPWRQELTHPRSSSSRSQQSI